MHFLNASVINAFIIHREYYRTEKTFLLRQFIEKFVFDLVPQFDNELCLFSDARSCIGNRIARDYVRMKFMHHSLKSSLARLLTINTLEVHVSFAAICHFIDSLSGARVY